MRSSSAPRRPPLFLLAMTALAIGSLGLGVYNQLEQQEIQTQRNDDRIAADLQSCERGNVFRQQIIDIGTANDEMISTILDTIFQNSASTPERQSAVAALRRQLDEPISKYRSTVAAIVITDCERAVPGAKEQPS